MTWSLSIRRCPVASHLVASYLVASHLVASYNPSKLQVAEHNYLTIGNSTPTTYHLKGAQLLNVIVYRELGVPVDDHCLFKQNISSICCKACSTINIIFCGFHTANVYTLIQAYKSFVRPVLKYWSTVWSTPTYQPGTTWHDWPVREWATARYAQGMLPLSTRSQSWLPTKTWPIWTHCKLNI